MMFGKGRRSILHCFQVTANKMQSFMIYF